MIKSTDPGAKCPVLTAAGRGGAAGVPEVAGLATAPDPGVDGGGPMSKEAALGSGTAGGPAGGPGARTGVLEPEGPSLESAAKEPLEDEARRDRGKHTFTFTFRAFGRSFYPNLR